MYQPEYTKRFYDAYGEMEWARLERSAYFRLEAVIHSDFIRRYVKPGDRVLDAGSGPGRFSILLAQLGASITVLDISSQQLSLAKQNLAEAKMLDHIERFVEGDISDLSGFTPNCYDVVVCFGGALSYVCEKRQRAVNELLRVTQPSGIVTVSVMSRLGSILGVTRKPDLRYLKEPDNRDVDIPNGSSFFDRLETGDLRGFLSSAGIVHAPMHLYKASELKELFQGH